MILKHEILPGLYLGDMHSAFARTALKERGVTHILCAAKGLKPRYPEDFVYKCVEILDDDEEEILCHFEDSIAFIEEGRKAGGILVHCAAGVSRSASLTVAYVMKQMELPYDQALDFVMRRRWISPNQGFVIQLKQYEARLGYNAKKKPVLMYCN